MWVFKTIRIDNVWLKRLLGGWEPFYSPPLVRIILMHRMNGRQCYDQKNTLTYLQVTTLGPHNPTERERAREKSLWDEFCALLGGHPSFIHMGALGRGAPLRRNKSINRRKLGGEGGDSWGASLGASNGPHPTIFPSRWDPTAQDAQSWRLVGINVGKMRCSRKGRNDIETNCRPVGEPEVERNLSRACQKSTWPSQVGGKDTHLNSPAVPHFLLYFMLPRIHSTDYKAVIGKGDFRA